MNETLAGRRYLCSHIASTLEDLSQLTAAQILERMDNAVSLKGEITQAGGEVFNYPKEGLPLTYIQGLISVDDTKPFQLYRMVLRSIAEGIQVTNRMVEHTGLVAWADHLLTNSTHSERLQARHKQLHPDNPLPSSDGWKRLQMDGPFSGLAERYKEDFKSWDDAFQQARVEGLNVVDSEFENKWEEWVKAGINDKIAGRISRAAENDLKDYNKASNAQKRRPSEGLVSLSNDENLLTDSSSQPDLQDFDDPEDAVYLLSELGLDLGQLTPGQREVVMDVREAGRSGYNFNPTQDERPMTEWWPDKTLYNRKFAQFRKARERLRQDTDS